MMTKATGDPQGVPTIAIKLHLSQLPFCYVNVKKNALKTPDDPVRQGEPLGPTGVQTRHGQGGRNETSNSRKPLSSMGKCRPSRVVGRRYTITVAMTILAKCPS